MKEFKIQDSGERQAFDTGAVRDTRTGKGRFDLISPFVMLDQAQLLEQGAIKYGDRNWEKGMPFSRFLDSALRHLNKFVLGYTDENHLAQAIWNLNCIVHERAMIAHGKADPALDDLPYYLRDDSEAK